MCWECECLVTCPSTHFSLDCWLCGWWWWWWSVSFCCSCSNFFFNSLFPYYIISIWPRHIYQTHSSVRFRNNYRVLEFFCFQFSFNPIFFSEEYILLKICGFFVLMFPAPNIIFFFHREKILMTHIQSQRLSVFSLQSIMSKRLESYSQFPFFYLLYDDTEDKW